MKKDYEELSDIVERIDSLENPYKELSLYTELLSNDEVRRDPSAVKLLVSMIHLSGIRAEDLYEKAKVLSMEDELTGLNNRRSLNFELKKELASAYRNPNRVFSVAAFDIDDFKSFNECHGHSGGDTVLKTLGNIASNNVRDSDSVFRISGDEFCILYRDTHVTDASVSAYNLSHQVADTKIMFRDKEGEKRKESIEISTGVMEVNQHNPVWLLYGAGGCQLVKDYVSGNSGLEGEISHYLDRYFMKHNPVTQRNIPDKEVLEKGIEKIGDFARDYIMKNNLDIDNVPISEIAINWVMENADNLAYCAKRNGKNCVAYKNSGKNMIYAPA